MTMENMNHHEHEGNNMDMIYSMNMWTSLKNMKTTWTTMHMETPWTGSKTQTAMNMKKIETHEYEPPQEC